MGYLRDVEQAKLRLPSDKYDLTTRERQSVDNAFDSNNIVVLKSLTQDKNRDLAAYAKERLDDLVHGNTEHQRDMRS